MEYRWAFCACLLAAGVNIVSQQPAGAQLDGRSSVSGRQEIRAELAAAMADGELNREEQYSILLRGKEVLDPDELDGLQRTLSRLASSQEVIPATVVEQPSSRAYARFSPVAASFQAERTGRPTDPAYELPAAPEKEESPFREESAEASPGPGPLPGPGEVVYSDDGQWLGDECGRMPDGTTIYDTELTYWRDWSHIGFLTTVDAFKGPLDLDGLNGNFGVRLGVNAGFPMFRRLGIGVQAGTSAVLSNFHGTEFTGDSIRQQNFTTAGVFQYDPFGWMGFKWGFGFDWMFDRYYESMSFQQWRIKMAYEWCSTHEIGIWAVIPDDGGNAWVGRPGSYVLERFEPVAQGNLYYRRYWNWLGDSHVTGWIGIAEEPGEFIFGGDTRVAIGPRWAVVGSFNYILPSARGESGRDEEMWNVSVGLEHVFGPGSCRSRHEKFVPLLPLADNGTFAVSR